MTTNVDPANLVTQFRSFYEADETRTLDSVASEFQVKKEFVSDLFRLYSVPVRKGRRKTDPLTKEQRLLHASVEKRLRSTITRYGLSATRDIFNALDAEYSSQTEGLSESI